MDSTGRNGVEPERDYELGEVQARFAEIIWANEPVASGDLVRICEKQLGWKKSTTYTVLRKLCEKGLFVNEDGVVRARMSRDEFNSCRSEQFVAQNFGGSLPAFVAAFTAGKKLTAAEAEEIRRMIDAYEAQER